MMVCYIGCWLTAASSDIVCDVYVNNLA